MTFYGTRRLIRAAALAAALTLGGVVLGRLELIVVAVPFVLVLAAGWRVGAEGAPVTAELTVAPERALEGETVALTLVLRSGAGEPEVEYAVAVAAGLEVASGTPHGVVTVPAGGERVETLELTARRWGAHQLGTVGLRVHGRGCLTAGESVVDLGRKLRVYPAPEPVRARPRPPETQVYAGNYVARAAGEGIEFAGVRAFVPGDSVRRVNWRVTSRRGGLYVNEYHPERNADVVFFIDSFTEAGPEGRTSLDLAVRGTAALARHYLRFKDRVGLVTFGGVVGWLNASMGEMHVHRIVDYLLDVGVFPSYAWKEIGYLPPRLLPPVSLVVVFSPLIDERAVAAVSDLHQRGHHLIVIDTLDEGWVRSEPSAEGRVAHRAWKLKRDALRFDLAATGIPVVRWGGKHSLESALAEVPRVRGRSRWSFG